MYHDGTAFRCAFSVGKKYGCSKGYPQRNAAHMGSISMWISFAASIFFAHKKNAKRHAVLSRYMYSYGQHFFMDILCCIHTFWPQKGTTPRCSIIVHIFRGAAIL